jgi:hypothetical protein
MMDGLHIHLTFRHIYTACWGPDVFTTFFFIHVYPTKSKTFAVVSSNYQV